MLFTIGGGFGWWVVDTFLIGSMVKLHNGEQEYSRRARLPPLALSFMPLLSHEVLDRPPEMILARLWISEVTINFVRIYAFATPIGAVLTLYLFVRPTHTVPRLLSARVIAAIVL
jgi:hypothetical protein